MPPYKTKKLRLTLIVIALATLPPALLFFFAQDCLLQLTSLSYFFPALAIFLMLKNTKKTSEHPDYSFFRWIGIIFLAELSLSLLFFSFLQTTSHDRIFLAKNIMHDLVWQWGLHPWAMIAVLSSILASLFFHQKKIPILSSIIPSLHNTHLDTFIRRFLQFILSIPTHFSIATTLSLGAVQLAGLLTKILHLSPVYSINIITLSFGFIIISLLNAKPTEHVIHFLCRKKISLGGFSLMMLIALSLLLTLENIIAADFQLSSFEIKNISLSDTAWKIIVWGWFTGWTLFFSSFIARISRGRSTRSIILGVLFFPIVFFIFYPHVSHIHFSENILNWLALTGPLILIFIFWRAHDSAFMTLGFMPNTDKNIFAKPRRMIKFIRPFLQSIVMLCLVYVWLGLGMLSLLMLLAVFLAFILLVLLSAGFLLAAF